jgi:hypothetical protein
MTELERQILHALERNIHRGGLTGSEIRQVLGLRVIDTNKIHKGLGRLIRRNEVKRQNHPDGGRAKVYSLLNEEIDTDSIEFQELPLHYVVRKPFNQTEQISTNSSHPLFIELKLSEILEDELSKWVNVSSPNDFPNRSGLYAFYSGKNNKCLYVGQTLNIRSRGLSHPIWRQALHDQELPYTAYKIIEYEDITKTKQELVYEECLLIGLLRPKWNVITPHQFYKV